jgi:hypothetical protein
MGAVSGEAAPVLRSGQRGFAVSTSRRPLPGVALLQDCRKFWGQGAGPYWWVGSLFGRKLCPARSLDLCREVLLLEVSQQPLRFGQGQTQVGDIGEIIRPFDLHDSVAYPSTSASISSTSKPRPCVRSRSKNRRGNTPLTLVPQNLRRSLQLRRKRLPALAPAASSCSRQS